MKYRKKTNYFCRIELFEIELFDPLTVCKQMNDVQLNCWLYIGILGTI